MIILRGEKRWAMPTLQNTRIRSSQGSLRLLRLLEMADCAIKLVTATWFTEPYYVTVIVREGIKLHRLARPRASLIDGIGDIWSSPRASLRLVEMAHCAIERVAAAGITEPHDIAVISRERMRLHRLPGPGAGFVDATGDIKNAHRAFLWMF